MQNKVLLIDDSPVVTTSLKEHFEKADFNVSIAGDGQAGLQALRDFPGFDVIMCDINMPKMRGIEMFEKMRDEGIHKNTPIFFLTTDGRMDTVKKLKSMGAAGFIQKGTPEQEIVGAVLKKLSETKKIS